MRKVFWALAAAAIVLGLGGVIVWQLLLRSGEETQERQRSLGAVAVMAVDSGRGLIRDTATFYGSVEAESRFVISPKIDGRLLRLRAQEGDIVRRGDLVAVLDDEELLQTVSRERAALAVAAANVDLAVAEFEVAEKEYARQMELRQARVATEAAFERAEADYKVRAASVEVAKAQVEQCRAALANAETRAGYARVSANWEGGSDERFFGDRQAEEGDLLRAHDPVGAIIDLDTLKAVVAVTEKDYAKLVIGSPVAIATDAFPGETFRGAVKRIPPLLREASRVSRVELAVPNADRRLRPGMFITAVIEFQRREDAVVVPWDALATRVNEADGSEHRGVYKLEREGDKTYAVFVPVETGLVEGDRRIEILRPADFSGRVVTLGQHLLGERTEVIPMDKGGRRVAFGDAGGGDAL